MNIKRLFAVPTHAIFPDLVLLLVRVVAGSAFIMHGLSKIQNPFGWMGPDAFAPGILQALAALSEFGGGIAWIVGLLTPLASLGIICTMAVAFAMHIIVRDDPFVAMTGGPSGEPAADYLCIALLILAFGAGRFSLDRKLFGERNERQPVKVSE